MNRLLLADQSQALPLARDILTHLLQVAAVKGLQSMVLGVLAKVIALLKSIQGH